MLHIADVAVADDDVRLAALERREEPRDVGAGVLIVGVGVDDEIGAGLEARVDARHERRGQALAAAEAHDVRDAVRARHGDRVVARAVVDDRASR